ncbi:MAG: hypothetical protein QGI83_09550 [Candidatus Latescibacteria bacterium]|jgi:hypothetical protein|nr:hypothetical protein [Candidatus Latescibacterota bacterium]
MIRATDRGDANIRPPVEAPVEGVVHRDASRPPAGDTLELTLNGLSPRLREALDRALHAEGDINAALDPQSPGLLESLDRVLNLGGGAAQLPGLVGEMDPEQLEAFLQALAELLKHGVVGYEYRWVNGEPQKVFIDVAIGSDLHRAPLVRDGSLDVLR